VLHRLADAMRDPFNELILLYSVGRCGGTLVSRAVNRLDGVLGLDEPDVYNNIVLMRPRDGSRDVDLTRLLHSCTRLLHRPSRQDVKTLFIKFRGTSTEIGDLMFKAFPASKGIFLYRNAETWAESAGRALESAAESRENKSAADGDNAGDFFRLFNLAKTPAGSEVNDATKSTARKREQSADKLELLGRVFPLLPPYIRRTLRSRLSGMDFFRLLSLMVAQQIPVVRNHCQTPAEFLAPYVQAIPPIKLLTLLWLSAMHRYLELNAMGIPMLAVSYETLVSAPEAALRAIFEHFELPLERVCVAQQAFGEDSQRGTPLSRERLDRANRKGLTPELREQLREVLREHPPVQMPDYVVPNSLDLALPARPNA